ncbi:hypothetical protein K0504_06220 [Neiella marina]|uniref:Uncharacterized protein n=1 Tax=Neiella holothuriorum TaxID=2870530 RepID=A0ABS7EFC2_9GAMM|nr:hypothetical protein [Neiella holothuriorum]MBW8190628.1 hypothetical protein [Neiella holothuriorum]
MAVAEKKKIQPQWWRKSLIATFGGLLLSYGLVGIFAWFGPGGIDANAKVQFNMWMITPIWLTILSFSFMFSTWRSALVYLGGANLIVFSSFIGLKWLL